MSVALQENVNSDGICPICNNAYRDAMKCQHSPEDLMKFYVKTLNDLKYKNSILYTENNLLRWENNELKRNKLK